MARCRYIWRLFSVAVIWMLILGFVAYNPLRNVEFVGDREKELGYYETMSGYFESVLKGGLNRNHTSTSSPTSTVMPSVVKQKQNTEDTTTVSSTTITTTKFVTKKPTKAPQKAVKMEKNPYYKNGVCNVPNKFYGECICPQDYSYTSQCEYIEADSKLKECNKKIRAFSYSSSVKCKTKPECQDLPERFKPMLSMENINLHLSLMETFTKTMESINATYIISGGTLLGSIRHHGFIPWDDDIDVYVNYTQLPKIKKAFSKLKSDFVLFRRREQNYKFHFKNATKRVKVETGKYGWPHVDLFPFKENKTHIQLQFHPPAVEKPFHFPKTVLFPTIERPFCHMMVTSPRKPFTLLSRRYKNFNYQDCKARTWNHSTNQVQRGSKKSIRNTLCSKFNFVYPYINRKQLNDSRISETLFIKNQQIGQYTCKCNPDLKKEKNM